MEKTNNMLEHREQSSASVQNIVKIVCFFLFFFFAGCWIWEYGTDSGESHNLLLEVGDRVRFRVVDEKFTDCSPIGPTLDTIQQQNLPSSYMLEAAMNEPGLGAITWWSNT